LGGTDTLQVIKEKYLKDKNFIVAGTSAGAMAIPKLMIYEGGKHEAMLKEDLKIAFSSAFLICVLWILISSNGGGLEDWRTLWL
jgi:cyanophycinase